MTEEKHTSTKEHNHKHKLFSDVSAVQVIATALAAVTSMFLASAIGIYGSIIGVAVASVISTLAASLYKRFLAESAEKLKELPLVAKTVALHSEKEGEEADTQALPQSKAALTRPEESDAKKSETDSSSADDTSTVAQSVTSKSTRTASHQKRMMVGLIVVCVVSALIAVAATAGVVYLATTGEGLGAKPAPIVKVEKVKETEVVHDDTQTSDTQASAAQNAEGDSSESTKQASSATSEAEGSRAASSSASSSSSASASSAPSSSDVSSASNSSASSVAPTTNTSPA